MAAIAQEAGVAVKTVYLAFETKSGVLRAVWHRLLRGEQDEVPIPGQAWFRQVVEEPDPERKLRIGAENSRIIKERVCDLMEALSIAARTEPDVAELWGRIQSDFRENQRSIVELLPLREGLDVEEAADVMWTINHPSVWQLLVGERGWTPERYERWLGDTLITLLLGR